MTRIGQRLSASRTSRIEVAKSVAGAMNEPLWSSSMKAAGDPGVMEHGHDAPVRAGVLREASGALRRARFHRQTAPLELR